MMEKALDKLDGETKLKLLDGFAKQRKYRLYFIAPVLFAYFLSLKFFAEQSMLIILIAGILFVGYFVARNIVNLRKIKAMAVPESYLRSFKIAIVINCLALVGYAIYAYTLFHSANQYDNQWAAYNYANKGVADMRGQNYQAGINDFTQAIQIDSTQDASYYVNRGTCFYYSGKMKEAKTDWTKAASMGNITGENYLKLIKE